MSNNIILKFLLNNISKKLTSDEYQKLKEDPVKDLSIFELVNIVGRNRLFGFSLILFIIFAYFLRANITIGVFFGFLFLSTIFYIYFKYLVFNLKDFTTNQQEKIIFLNTLLNQSNKTMSDSLLSTNENWIILGDQKKSYLYLNPVVIDFYYKNKYILNYSYGNFVRSLNHINNMIKLEKQIEEGLDNRGNQYTLLLMLEKRCLNEFQSTIYELPSATATNQAFQKNLNFLHKITQNIIKNAENKINEQNKKDGINTGYYPIYNGGPSPNDIGSFAYNNHFDFFT